MQRGILSELESKGGEPAIAVWRHAGPHYALGFFKAVEDWQLLHIVAPRLRQLQEPHLVTKVAEPK
jgi:hypothetical protein